MQNRSTNGQRGPFGAIQSLAQTSRYTLCRPSPVLRCGDHGGGTIDFVMPVWKPIQATKRGIEQAHRATQCSSLRVMIRSRELNQALQELTLVTDGW